MLSDHDDNDDFPDHFTYFEYSEENFNKRLDYIFDRLFKEKYLDCKSLLIDLIKSKKKNDFFSRV